MPDSLWAGGAIRDRASSSGQSRKGASAEDCFHLYPSTEDLWNSGNSRCGRPAQGLGYFPRSEQGLWKSQSADSGSARLYWQSASAQPLRQQSDSGSLQSPNWRECLRYSDRLASLYNQHDSLYAKGRGPALWVWNEHALRSQQGISHFGSAHWDDLYQWQWRLALPAC